MPGRVKRHAGGVVTLASDPECGGEEREGSRVTPTEQAVEEEDLWVRTGELACRCESS